MIDNFGEIPQPQDREPTPPNKENEERLHRLGQASETLFNAWGGGYARFGEPGFSGDAASIFTLVALPEGHGTRDSLVKVGWGEFSQNTFENGQYPAFHQFPKDIYCVPQMESYFAGDRLRQQMQENPADYLAENSVFVANNGRVTLAQRDQESRRRHLDTPVTPVPYDEMLATVRNGIVTTKATPEAFADFLKALPDDPEELGRYSSDLFRRTQYPVKLDDSEESVRLREQARMMGLVIRMGINEVGSMVGDRKSMESILEMKSKFDFDTHSFK